jgi:F0F1-type ATP synthase assembly protein I
MEHSTGRQKWAATRRQALATLNIGWDLAMPIFLGVLGGNMLDQRWGTGSALTIGLLLFGLLVGVYNLARTLQRELRRDQEPSTARVKIGTGKRAPES